MVPMGFFRRHWFPLFVLLGYVFQIGVNANHIGYVHMLNGQLIFFSKMKLACKKEKLFYQYLSTLY